jgi:CDP-L-myo-inositol myo-inositolphosphotransferase
MLDGVDGELARAKFLVSRAGAWFDTACDEATNLMFLVGVIVGIQRQARSRAFFWLGVATLGLYLLTLVLLYGQLAFGLRRTSLLAFQEEIHKPEFRKKKGARLILLLQPLIKRDLYAFLFMLLCLAGFPRLIVVLWLVAVVLTPVLFLKEVLGSIGRGRA